jgi:arylsulfatase A
MRHSLIWSVLALACPLRVPAAAQSGAGELTPPNVVYILADDLGYGELGCYGQKRIKTPNIDRLAREGMRLTQHYSGSPVCAPSRCVLLTGMHTGHSIVRDNWENGGWGEDAPEGQYPLPAGTLTLASALKPRGYQTASVGKWGLGGPETSGHPNQQGFDLFYGYLCQRKAHNYYPTHLWRNGDKVVLEGNPFFKSHQRLQAQLANDEAYWGQYAARQYAPELMNDEALAFVRANASKPFLLYYASPIPHAALQVPPEDLEAYPAEWDESHYLGQKSYLPHPSPRRAYAAMVSHLDAEVGRILDLLDELGLTKNTIVMFSSDNGPTFNGGTDSTFFESADGLRGLKCSVYEGGLRVPMIARWPGHIAAGTTSEHVSAFQDVLPTMLELTGGEPASDIDGISFAPTLLGTGAQAAHDYLYWEYKGQQAMRRGNWKAVRSHLKKKDLTIELYDLQADRAEQRDVAGDNPELIAEFEELFAAARFPSDVYPIEALDE